MLRRIVSFGQQAADSDDSMSSPNDAGRASDSKSPAGLAGVFKGLTGSKLTRSAPTPVQSPAPPSSASSSSRLPPMPLSGSLAPATAALSSSSVSSTQPPSEPSPDTISIHNTYSTSSLVTYADCLEQLCNGSIHERVAAASALRGIVAESPIDSIFDVWHAARDLIEPAKPPQARHAGWDLLAECAKHTSSTNLERKEYFQTITAPADPDDFHLQLRALFHLTNNGRDLSGFDYDLFPVLTDWFNAAYKASKNASKRLSARSSGSGASINSGAGGSKSSKGKTGQSSSMAEKNLAQLFSFTIDVLKCSFKTASDSAIDGLLDAVLDIAMNTSVEDDLAACIDVVHACVMIGVMPAKSLERCVKVLSSIYCLVPKLQKSAWSVQTNIFKSHYGLGTIRILILILRNYPPPGVEVKDATREVRGALSVLKKLVSKAGTDEYPLVPYATMVDGLGNVASHTPSPRVVAFILQLINQLLDDGEDRLSPLVVDEDWAPLLDVATKCAKRSNPLQAFDAASVRKQYRAAGAGADESSQDMVDREAAVLTARIEGLVRGLLHERPEYSQKNSCITYLAAVHPILPDSGAELVLKYYQEFHCCFPSDPQWDANLRLVLDAFYAKRSRSAFIRLLALKTAIDVHNVLELVDGAIDAPDAVPNLVRRILVHVGEERDMVILHHTVSFTVDIAASVDPALYDFILEALRSVVENDERRQPPAGASPSVAAGGPAAHPDSFIDQSTSNIAAKAIAWIFMKTMNYDAEKAIKAFEALLDVARDNHCPIDARLTALKLFFRLRADWANRIFLISNTESDSLAAVLLRTEASMDRKIAEEVSQQMSARQLRAEPGGLSPPPLLHPPRGARGISFSQAGGGAIIPDRSVAPARPASGARQHAPTHRYRQLWMLPDPDALPEMPLSNASTVLYSYPLGQDTKEAAEESEGEKEEREEGEKSEKDKLAEDKHTTANTLDIASWMEIVFDLLTKGANWELYSFVLVHLPSQLSNHAVCRGAVPVILRIRASLCDQMRLNSSQEPPPAMGLRRPEAQTCILQTLTMILSYHEYFTRQEGDDLVRTFIAGLMDKNPITCVKALSICCFELPNATAKSLVTILQKMSQIITRPGVAIHILELLACLSRLPWLYSNFREDEFRIAFGVCFRYLQSVRDRRSMARASHHGGSETQQQQAQALPAPTMPNPTAAQIYGAGAASGETHSSDSLPVSLTGTADDLPEYVYALAYHVLTYWFLALRLPDRANYVTWIASRLFVENDGRQIMEEQAQITLNFMQQVAFSDADESMADEESKAAVAVGAGGRSWIIGNCILTIQPAADKPGWATIIKRQPSATSYYTIRENLRVPPPHRTRGMIVPLDGLSQSHHANYATASNAMLPSHLLAQLIAPVPQPHDSVLRPIPLPDDEAVARAFRTFDRNSTVDGHKVGVIYIGEGQTDESDILSNVSGSSDYVEFLDRLGTLVRLKGATFNTQGLDREYDTDGAYTFCWRDRVTEMVFHVTTQMPTDRQRDPLCINKKRHIGNDYVNIIFNDSGLAFRFDTFPSEFNYVNIVITPESRSTFLARRELALKEEAGAETGRRAMPFYRVRVMSKPGFPEISPAAETKIISLRALPDFIRLLALNASVFSLVWANRKGGEHVSSWQSRLRHIVQLRERYRPATAGKTTTTTSSGGVTASATAGGGSAGGSAAAAAQQPSAGLGSGSAGTAAGGGGGAASLAAVGGMAGGGAGGAGGAGVRDSFNSLRRSSMATFFSATSEATSHRSSVHSTATTLSDGTETAATHGSTDAWVESMDFSRWT